MNGHLKFKLTSHTHTGTIEEGADHHSINRCVQYKSCNKVNFYDTIKCFALWDSHKNVKQTATFML